MKKELILGAMIFLMTSVYAENYNCGMMGGYFGNNYVGWIFMTLVIVALFFIGYALLKKKL